MENYFSSNLQYIREKRGLSKSDLAKRLKVHQSTISRWENNEMGATIDNALDISEILGVPLPTLLGIDMSHENTTMNENDEQTKKIATENGVEISYAKEKELNAEDVLEINKILMEELSKKKDNNSWIG